MVATTLPSPEERKKALAKRLSKRMGEIRVTYQPNYTLNVNANDEEADPTSKGHVFTLDGAEFGEFPCFSFEVCVDDRHNNGDLAQSVVDELFALANAYMEVAKRNARRLNREPKPIQFRWEDLTSEIDWEQEERMAAREREKPVFEDIPRTKPADDPERIKAVLPNGDLVIDGTDLYRVMSGDQVSKDLCTKAEADRYAWMMNDLCSVANYTVVGYAELAAKAESVA